MSTMAPTPLKYQLTGAAFVAQACSCAQDSSTACTGDPCICGEPCPCEGADLYLGPRWRFVGTKSRQAASMEWMWGNASI